MKRIKYCLNEEPICSDGYSVSFPDIESCSSFGVSLKEAVETAQGALFLVISTMEESGEGIPRPTDINSASLKPDGSVIYILVDAKRCEISTPCTHVHTQGVL